MPLPLPLPTNATNITPHVGSIQKSTGNPLYWKFEVTKGGGFFGFMGQKCAFEVTSKVPCNLGIYGPNPTQIGPPFGRMRSPKNGDAKHHICEGNFTPGTYYLVVREGDDGSPSGPVEIMVTVKNWWF